MRFNISLNGFKTLFFYSVGMVIALVGNKADLSATQREVPLKDAQLYAENVGILHIEASAKTALNVKLLFEELAKQIPLSSPVVLVKTRDKDRGRDRERDGGSGSSSKLYKQKQGSPTIAATLNGNLTIRAGERTHRLAELSLDSPRKVRVLRESADDDGSGSDGGRGLAVGSSSKGRNSQKKSNR